MTASYVPPPVPEMHEALTDLERFLHVRTGIPPLVQVALAHAQFETIHPFLDGNGACRIYQHRPYVCRTQGLPLQWIERHDNGKIVAMRDICPLNEKGTPIEQLPEDCCWKIGPTEESLAKVQYGADKKNKNRVSLRSLFRLQGPNPPN